MIKQVLSDEQVNKISEDNVLVLYASETPIQNKDGEDCSFIEYICKDKYETYKFYSDKKNNYFIVFEKDKLNKNDFLNIVALIEYREALYSFDDVDMFEIVKDIDNEVWKHYVELLDNNVTKLQDMYVSFGTKEYDEYQKKLDQAIFIKYIFTEGMGVEKNYVPSNEFMNRIPSAVHKMLPDTKDLAKAIIENTILPKVIREAKLRAYLSDKIAYKLIKNELLRFSNKEYKECFKKIKDLRNDFYVKNNIYNVKYNSEWELYKLVKLKYDNAMFQYSPEFLGRQRYDIYIPNLKTAIEYQGEQHYHQIDFFGPLEEIQKRDARKKELSDLKGINIIYWKYDEPIDKKTLDSKI